MAAYSAVVSLQLILNQSTDHFPEKELDPLKDKASSLKSSIENIFPAPKKERSEANKLGAQIRDAVYKAQDSIESFVFSKIHPSESRSSTSISLQEIIANLDPIIKEAEELAVLIGKDKKVSEPVNEADTYKASKSGTKTRIVGQEEDKKLVEGQLLSPVDKREVIPITGMPGIGKTTLARSIFEDRKIMSEFPYRAWVTVSQDYNTAEILGKLLTSVESRGQKGGEKVYEGTEATLREKLHQTLYNNKYLVVIDDMWDDEAWNKLQLSLPDNENKSRVLLTTRIRDVAKAVASSNFVHVMKPLNEEDSWTLLSIRTFGEKPCPTPSLEAIGKEIAKNCRGLPLSLTVIGGLLSQESKTDEYWKSIEEDIYAATSDKKADDENVYKEILSLSYEHLPPKLKGCFLYMGAFREDSEILTTKLIRLWVAEGFLPRESQAQLQLVEAVAEKSLTSLIDRNLVLIRKNSSHGRIKSCGVHDSLRELAEQESGKDKFFHYRKKYIQEKKKDTDSQRRISIQKNILMCLEEVYNATTSITQARSLLFVGPHHHHPMPFVLTFDLLRVIDAYTVYFIEFPHAFLKLIHLKYLALTYNGKLPSKLSELQKLQALIVRRQPKIIFVGSSYLPDEIWKMPQLRHLIFTESDIPIPPDALLTGDNEPFFKDLQSLSNVNATNLTEKVLRNMPNLRKLGMWLESPCEFGLYLKQVEKIENFTFMVLNPVPGKAIKLSGDGLYFPETVMKLDLSGCGLPWDKMEIIGKLPNLEVLKLRELAFHGEGWCPTYVFHKLKFLMIEYLNLKWWETDGSHYPCLEQLILRHCYEFEEDGIPTDIGALGHLELIELVDCSPDAVNTAEKILKEQEDFGNERLQVRIYSSWE